MALTPGVTAVFAESATEQVTIASDAVWGYDLGIKAKSGDNSLVNGQYKITSIPGAISKETFRSDARYNNMWGFLPSKVNGAANTNYLAGPTANGVTLEKTKAGNGGVTVAYDITIGAKVDFSVAAGNYSNTFVVTGTANSAVYNITYDLNDGTWGGKTPQSGETTERNVTLDTHAPSKSNAEFMGWCTVDTTNETCTSGQVYQPGQAYDLSRGASITLHAMWKAKVVEDPTGCKALAQVGQTGMFTDPRDNNKYTIARLADGKCWMTQDLRIIGMTIDSTNSDMTSGSYTIPASDLSAFSVEAPDGIISTPNNQAVYYDSTVNDGAYYTWQVATAGSGSAYTTQDQNVPDSICPKGWRLPTGDLSESDFDKLIAAYDAGSNGTALTNKPMPGLVRAGHITYGQGGKLLNHGSYGYYWSSTVYDATRAYALEFRSSVVSLGAAFGRVYGQTVRCVADEE